MNSKIHKINASFPTGGQNSGTVLIIVMWISFGLICLALYFGHSMSFELRAADNREANAEADQAIEGAARYVTLVLSNNLGYLPDIQTYQSEAVPVGNCLFWIIGRADSDNASTATVPTYGLIDEASKLNLNTAAYTNLIYLPNMTVDLVASILNWAGRTNETTSLGGAMDTSYSTLKPPYYMKGTNFESVSELRMVYGMTTDILYGEDANLNGVLDPNENDGDVTPPVDNRDGRLDPGLFEYLTVCTSDPNLDTNGNARVSVNDSTSLLSALTNKLSSDLASKVVSAATGTTFTSMAQFYNKVSSVLTVSDFEKVADSLAVNTNSPIKGLINVNTASATVLASLEGFTSDMVNQLVAYRRNNPTSLKTIAWVATVLSTNIPASASNLTTQSYQFTADIAALGHHNRGYKRVRFVFDTSTGIPQIIFRQDLSYLGWALGSDVRNKILTSKETR